VIVAGVQVRKTRTATEAATTAVERTETYLRRSRLLTLLPELSAIEHEFTFMQGDEQRGETLRLLVRWRRLASAALGLLDGTTDEIRGARVALVKANALAKTSKDALLRNTPVAEGTRKVREAIDVATELIGQIAAELEHDAREVSAS
jgi:hypothetical protein